jgi:RNA polymerase sigma factor (sigma-70 family)
VLRRAVHRPPPLPSELQESPPVGQRPHDPVRVNLPASASHDPAFARTATIAGVRLDEQLQRARAGDAAATAALIEHYLPRVAELAHRQLERRCRSQDRQKLAVMSTGDLVQDVLIEVLRGLDHWDGSSEEQFVGLLATLVEFRLIDLLRSSRSQRRDERRNDSRGPETSGVTDAQRSPATLAMTEEQLQIYRRVVATFADRERALLTLRLEDGVDYAALAATLAYPSADAARKAFHAVQARLLLRLRQSGLDSTTRSDGRP